CPFCASIAPELRALVADRPGQVAVWFRHMPLDKIHPHARAAALASACADEQGRFAELHDTLFAQQDSIGGKAWEAFAREAGVRDLAAFGQCMDTRRHAARIEADLRAAKRLQVRATPTVIINGLLIEGTLTRDELEKHVADAARRPRRTAARTSPTPEEP
ncbi:MAG TPA: thioredoxin domain-containing protein, partial [Longimicrobium sp.]|nr:thioredoxin domain-containing protein [Longimicrobium sp.]